MPAKKSIKDVTFKELEEILKTLQVKFLKERERFESFLPELVPLLEKTCGSGEKPKRSRAKKAGSVQLETPNFQEKKFTLIDEFLTEREKKARYERALSILQKFKETGQLSSEEMKRFVVNAALSDFKNWAQPEDLPYVLRMVEHLINVNLADEAEKEVTFIEAPLTKEYQLTDRIYVHLDKDFSLAKIEVKTPPWKNDSPLPG